MKAHKGDEGIRPMRARKGNEGRRQKREEKADGREGKYLWSSQNDLLAEFG